MTTFDDRERGFEAHFAHDEEVEFKAMARRDRQVGLWAAEKLGLAGDEAQNYALSIMREDLKEPGDADVFRKLSADLAGKASEAEIRQQMDALLATARADIHAAR